MADGLMAMPSCDAPEADSSRTDGSSVDDRNTNYTTTTKCRSVDDSFLFHPKFDPQGRHPFQFKTVHHYQQNDTDLQELQAAHPNRYFIQDLDSYNILCRYDTIPASEDTPWKIVIPNNMLRPLVQWYHEITVHSTGMDRLEALIRRHFYHPDLRKICREVISACTICPQVRVSARPSGQLAPRIAPILPWSEVHIDFIGPWKVKVNNQVMEFNALTCIDPVTNLTEIVRLQGNKTAENASRLFENHWLSRYPRPARVVHDHGPEFQGHDFQFPIDYAGITPINISPNTPTANSICEASHKIIGQVIRTLINLKPPTDQSSANNLVDEAFATAMHAMRCNPVSTLGNFSPGALVFNRDMFLNIPLVADILTLTKNRQALIDRRLLQANRRRTRHEFKVNQYAFVTNYGRDGKLDLVKQGPYQIIQVHTNNTVTLRRGQIEERISIRHLTPYNPIA
jgi:hypothetical protein